MATPTFAISNKIQFPLELTPSLQTFTIGLFELKPVPLQELFQSFTIGYLKLLTFLMYMYIVGYHLELPCHKTEL